MADKLIDVHARAIEGFSLAQEPTVEEREMALRDRRFVAIAGAQYEGSWGEQFINTPRIEIDKTGLGMDKIFRDYQANRITVDFRPVGDASSEETADMLDGIFRADMYRCNGGQAVDTAFYEASAGGLGALRLVDVLEDELDPENEYKRIDVEQIVDADQSVWWDGNAKQFDKRDATCCWVITAMARTAFERTYSTNFSDWPINTLKPFYDWFTPDVVKIAEYYEVETVSVELYLLTHPLIAKTMVVKGEDAADEVRELKRSGWRAKAPRKVKQRKVHKYIMSGAEVLEDCGYVAGDRIPIVMFYGKRLFIDNMERTSGYVRKLVDPQRVLNMQVSSLVEIASITPQEVPIVTPEQMAGHDIAWAEANIKRHPYRMLNPIVQQDGTTVSQGPVGNISPPTVPPVTGTLLQAMSGFMDEIGNAQDASKEVKSNVSAQAMEIAAQRTDSISYSYMDNARQSMRWLGEIYLSKAREIYVEEGRTVETLGEDGERGELVLGQDVVDESGRFKVINDLSRGRYMVISDVTEQTTTRRDKTARTMLNVASAAGAVGNNEFANAAIITAVLNMDGEGMTEFKDWTRKQALALGLAKPTDEEMQAAQQEEGQREPSAEQQMAQAKAQELQASAAYKAAQAQTEGARTGLVQAQTMEAVANAEAMAKGDITPNADPLEQVSKVAQIAETEARTALLRADARKKGADAVSTVAALGPAHPAMQGPQPGDVEDGHMFKGGDPSDAANWQALQ